MPAMTVQPAFASRVTRLPVKMFTTANIWLTPQGEDVVAGIRTPQPMASKGDGNSLEEKMAASVSGTG